MFGQNSYSNNDSIYHYLNNSEVSDSLKHLYAYRLSQNCDREDEGIEFAKLAYKYAKACNQYRWMAASKLTLGQLYKKMGFYELAMKSFFESLEFYRINKNSKGVASCELSIGDLYLANDDLENALTYYKSGLDIFKHKNDSLRLAISLLNVGSSFQDRGKYNHALEYYGYALDCFESIGHDSGVAFSKGNIGGVYCHQDLFNESLPLLEEAIQVFDSLNDYHSLVHFQLYFAETLLGLKHFKKSNDLALQSLKIAKERGFLEQVMDVSYTLSKINYEQEDYKKAYEYYKQSVLYGDSLSKEDIIRKIGAVRTQHEVEQKQSEVDVLESEKQLFVAMGVLMVLIIILISLLATVLYRNARINRRKNIILENQKHELEIQHQELDQLNNTKDLFFSIISHDLRGPIASFQGLAELIRLCVNNGDMNSLVEVGNQVDDAARNVSGLLNNLLSWALSQKGSVPVHKEILSLCTIVNDVLSVFKNMSVAKGIEVEWVIPVEATVYADKNGLETILRNLVNNALKFTNPGGTIYIFSKMVDDKICITVKDTGIGIEKKKLDTLFEVSVNKHTWGTDNEKGVGLGLRLVSDFAAMNNGTVHVESVLGKGTEFHVCFPCSKPFV